MENFLMLQLTVIYWPISFQGKFGNKVQDNQQKVISPFLEFGSRSQEPDTRHSTSIQMCIPVPEQIVCLLGWFQKQAAWQTKEFTGAGVHNYLVHDDKNHYDRFIRLNSHSLSSQLPHSSYMNKLKGDEILISYCGVYKGHKTYW
jgi:hypothetical protein